MKNAFENSIASLATEMRNHPNASAALILFEDGHRIYELKTDYFGENSIIKLRELHLAESDKIIRGSTYIHRAIERLLEITFLPADFPQEITISTISIESRINCSEVILILESLSSVEYLLKASFR